MKCVSPEGSFGPEIWYCVLRVAWVACTPPYTRVQSHFRGRHMKLPKMAMLAVALGMLTSIALPQDKDKGQASGPDTKLQIFFSELETQWLKAIQAKDPAALNRIVSDDFHLRTAAPPGTPVSRSDWLLAIFGRRIESFDIRQLTVRELTSQIAVVSFVQSETYLQTATPQTENLFVVDVWVNSGTGDNWRCTDRYTSEIKAMPSKK